jgi:hypothetical protein
MDLTKHFQDGGATITIHSPPTTSGNGVVTPQDEMPSFRNGQRKPVSQIFRMAKGYVRRKPGSTPEERKLFWEKVKFNPQLKDDPSKRPVSESWCFFNKQLKSIQLYAGQISALVDLLPSGYEAALKGDVNFFEVIAEGKTNRLTLEVFYYKEELILAMKKYYIPENKVDDDTQEWLPTSAHFPFDPEKDDPIALLEYVLNTADN